jgi:hypothetical protein
VAAGTTSNNAPIVEQFCETDLQAQDESAWRLVFVSGLNYRFVNGTSNRCLGIENASTALGARAVQLTCDNSSNQLWTLSVVALPGVGLLVNLKNVNAGRCIGTDTSRPAVPAQTNGPVTLQTCGGQANKAWLFTL